MEWYPRNDSIKALRKDRQEEKYTLNSKAIKKILYDDLEYLIDTTHATPTFLIKNKIKPNLLTNIRALMLQTRISKIFSLPRNLQKKFSVFLN